MATTATFRSEDGSKTKQLAVVPTLDEELLSRVFGVEKPYLEDDADRTIAIRLTSAVPGKTYVVIGVKAELVDKQKENIDRRMIHLLETLDEDHKELQNLLKLQREPSMHLEAQKLKEKDLITATEDLSMETCT